MKKILIVCCAILSFPIYSQTEDLGYKHEIGLNLAPVIIPLYTGEFDFSKIEVSHVKHRSSNFSWRTKLSIQRVPYGGVVTPDNYYSDTYSDTISSNSDITVIEKYYQKEVNVMRCYFSGEYTVKLGFVQFYTGLGLVPGLVKNNSFKYRLELNTGTSYGSAAFNGNFYFRSFMIGVSPYLGLKIPLSERFLINFQTGVEFDYHFRDFQLYNSTQKFKTDRTELMIWPVMTELGIYFQF